MCPCKSAPKLSNDQSPSLSVGRLPAQKILERAALYQNHGWLEDQCLRDSCLLLSLCDDLTQHTAIGPSREDLALMPCCVISGCIGSTRSIGGGI